MSIPMPKEGWNIQRITTHPGEILLEDFLKPMNLNPHSLSMHLHVPVTRIVDIVKQRRGVTPDTALRLARFFGTSAEMWLSLQQNYDLSKAKMELKEKIEKEVTEYNFSHAT